jgi:formiminoglutamase
MSLKPVSSQLFFSRKDKQDPRLGEMAEIVSPDHLRDQNFALLGYCDDSGIVLNGGRPGAKEAPDQIRTFLYKMTPEHRKIPRIADLGNLTALETLDQTHQMAFSIANKTIQKTKLISLGGGHDFAFADGSAFLENQNGDKKPLIINFDAHLDVRPTDKGNHSGTPFRRLLEKYQGKFDFIEIGIQNQCNSPFHWEWALDHGAIVLSLETIEKSGILENLQNNLDTDRQRPLWLSVDIDAFSSNEAPGCSQSWATGLHIREFLPVLQFLVHHFNVKGLGVYEVSPPLDQDHRTSKLAALIIHRFIFASLAGGTFA